MQRFQRYSGVRAAWLIPVFFCATPVFAQGSGLTAEGMSPLFIGVLSTAGVLLLVSILSIVFLCLYRKKARAFSQKCDELEPALEKTGKELGVMKVRFSSVIEQNKRLLEESGAAFFKLDLQGQCVYANEALVALYGMSKDAVMGNGLVNSVHPEDRERMLQLWRGFEEPGALCEQTYRIRRKDGSFVYVSERGSLIRSGDNSVCGYFAVVTDVSEQEKRLQDVLTVQRRGDRFIDQTVAGFYELRPEKPIPLDQPAEKVAENINRHMKLVSCSSELAQFYGCPVQEMPGKGLKDLPGESGLMGDFHDLQQFVSGGLSAVGRERVGADHRGTPHYLRTDAVGMIEDGQLVCIMGAQYDISAQKREKEKADQQLAFYRRILDTLPGDVFVKDPRCRYLFVSRSFEERTGVPADDWIDKTVFEVLPAVPRDFNAASIQAMKSGALCRKVSSRPGTDEWFETIEHPLVSEDGVVEGVVGISVDASERIERQHALQKSESMFRYLVESNPAGMVMADSASHKLQYANPAFCDLFGYTENEVADLTVGDLHSPGSRRQVLNNWNGRARGTRRFDEALACQRKDRSVLYADVGVSLGQFDGSERTIGVYSDAAGRRKIESGLERQCSRVESILRDASMVIATVDRSGVIRSANDALLELIGMDEPDLVGRSYVGSLVFKDDRGVVNEALSADVSNCGDACDYRIVTKSGELVSVSCRIRPRSDEAGFTVTGIDVTAQRAKEQRLLEERSSLQATIQERETQLAETHAALEDSQKQSEALRQDIATLNAEHAEKSEQSKLEQDAHQRREAELNKELEERRAHEDELTEEGERLSGELAETKAALQERTHELETDRSEYETVRTELSERVVQLEKELSERTEELEAAVTSRTQREEEMERLDARLQDVTEKLKFDLRKETKQCTLLDEQLSASLSREDELVAERKRLRSELAEAQTAFHERAMELASTRSDTEKMRTQLGKQVVQLEKDLADRTGELEAAVASRSEREEKLQQLDAQLKDVSGKLQAELDVERQQRTQLEEALNASRAHEEELTAEGERLSGELADAKAELKKRTDELKHGQSESETVHGELRERIDELESSLADRTGELDVAVKARADQEELLLQLDARVKDLSESLQEELAKETEQRRQFKDELAAARTQEKELTDKGEQLSRELAETQVALKERSAELEAGRVEAEKVRKELSRRIVALEEELGERTADLDAAVVARGEREKALKKLDERMQNVSGSLQDDLARVTEQRSLLEEALNESRSHEEKLTAEGKRLSSELATAQTELEKQVKALDAEQREREAASAELDQRTEELAAAREAGEKQERTFTETKAALEETVTALRAELSEESALRSKLDQDLKASRKNLEDKENKLTKTRSKLEEKNSECDRLGNELNELRMDASANLKTIEARVAQKSAAVQKELDELRAREKQLVEAQAAAKGQVDKLSKKLKARVDELETARAACRDLEQAVAHEKSRVAEQVKQSNEALAESRETERSLSRERIGLKKNIEELEAGLKQRTAELALAIEQRIDLENLLAESREQASSEHAKVEDQVDQRTRELKKQLQHQWEREEQMKADQKKMKERMERLQEELEVRSSEVDELKKLQSELKEQMALEQENDAQRTQLYKEEMQESRRAQRVLEESKEEIQDELESVKNSLARQERETARQTQAYQQAEGEVDRLRTLIEEDGGKVFTLANDLEEPLGPVVELSATALEDDELSAGVQGHLKQINSCGRRMLSIVHYQQEIFRMDHDGVAQNPQPVELNRFLADLTDEYTEMAQKKKLFFALSRSNNLPQTIGVDPAGVHRVLDSLFNYALEKAKSKDRMGVHVAVEEAGEGRQRLVFLLVFSSLNQDAVITGGMFDEAEYEKSCRDMSEEEMQLFLTRRYAQMMGGSLCLQMPTELSKRLNFSLPIDIEDVDEPEEEADAKTREKDEIAWL